MNTDNGNTNRTARKFRSMFAAAVALMLVAAACSQTVEETAQTAAATTTTPTAAGTTTPDVSTATTAAVARDDGGGAEGAASTDASDEEVTTGTEEPGAPDTTIGDSDTTVDVGGEADDTPAGTEKTDGETGAGEEAGDSEPDGGGGSDGATPGDEDDGEESDTEIGNEDEGDTGETDEGDGDSDNEETDGEPDSGEGEDNNSDDTDGSDDNEGGDEEETSGNTYPSSAEEARAAGLMVVDSALVLSSLRLPSDAENYYPETDEFLNGATEWGLWLPKKKELWVPPSTGNTHHIELEADLDDWFFSCLPSMRNPVATLRAGDLVTMRSAPNDLGVTCYGNAIVLSAPREIHEPHGHRVVAVVPWSVFGRDYQTVIMCTAGGEWAGGAGFVLVRIDEDRTVWKQAIARLPSVYPCNHNAP